MWVSGGFNHISPHLQSVDQWPGEKRNRTNAKDRLSTFIYLAHFQPQPLGITALRGLAMQSGLKHLTAEHT